MKKERILCVDDDKNVLSAFKRNLRGDYVIRVADEGDAALKLIREDGPFAVILSDMKMPGMNGIELLQKVKDLLPETTRIMITGLYDLDLAVDAVNEGAIFKFLTKPCSSEKLKKVIASGVEQYRLIRKERELLEKTVVGVIKVISEIISMTNPLAFSRTLRILDYIKHMSRKLALRNPWQYEAAAFLSQIGCVTIPPITFKKLFSQKVMLKTEEEMFRNHARIGADLLKRIPRMEVIAGMVENQNKPFSEFSLSERPDEEEMGRAIGAQMLKIALDCDQIINSGSNFDYAIKFMSKRKHIYNPNILYALQSFEKIEEDVKRIRYEGLKCGMIFNEDIRTKNGLLLFPKGQKVTPPVLMRLKSYADFGQLREPFDVMNPEVAE